MKATSPQMARSGVSEIFARSGIGIWDKVFITSVADRRTIRWFFSKTLMRESWEGLYAPTETIDPLQSIRA